MSSSTLALDPERELKFIALQNEAKQLAAEGKLKESLKKFEMAKEICPTVKVLRRIVKLKDCIKQYCGEEPNSENVSLVSRDSLPSIELENTKNRSSVSRNSSLMPKALSNIENLEQSRFSRTDELSPRSQSKFRELKKTAKELSYEGHYEEAVMCFRKALRIFDCPKVKRYIKELELVMKNSDQIMEQNENLSDIVKPEIHPCYSDSLNIIKPKSPLLSSEAHSDSVSSRELQCSSSLNHVETKNKVIPRKSSAMLETSDSDQKLSKVKELYYEARELAAEGKLKESLRLLKKAFAIHETEKVLKQIKKIEELLCEEAEGDEMVNIASDFKIFHEIYDKLYPYQREGVAWMWQLFKKTKGGVLGDDMGLGKTFQVIAFISGMIDADLIKHVLIIMPVSLICNWRKEFKKWCPGISVSDFHGGTKKERERNLLKVQKRGHVLLTSYGMLVSNLTSLINMDGKEFIWDYVILDEGHKIKNPTKTTKAVHDIPAKNRLLLTGTPIQNNLRELWSLYDFVHQGTLLGSLKTFKMQYENPITRSREKDATAGEKRLGTEMAENLKAVIKPYFLRRTKEEIWGNNNQKSEVEELGSEIENMSISKLTAKKNDLILWTLMSEPQIDIYKSFLHSDAVKAILVSKRSPLVELTTLKKICDHPRLLSKRACMQLGLNGELLEEDLLQNLDDESSQASTIDNVSDETLLQESGKLNLVIKLLENLRETGHRTLVFSLSRKILDMIHRILVNRNWKVMRVDGTISKMEERERRIQKFQRDPSYSVFLLTTQVGGVGITLTAADRVIIYDPSWNPATDSQAVDRVYRIGQQKDVVVYRFITCGTVEEKIYRRQVFKDSITRQTTGNTAADPYRYFSKQELRELFSLEDPFTSATQIQLSEMHSSERSTSKELETHIAFLEQLNIFGISDHDLMFSRNIEDPTEDNECLPVSYDYIKRQVATAHELIQKEAFVVAEGMRLAGVYSRPYQKILPLPKKAPTKDSYKPPVLPPVIDLTEDAQHFPSYKKEHTPTAFQPSGFIDLTSEQPLDKDFANDAGTVSTPGKDEQIRFEVGRFFSTSDTRNSPVIPLYENISEIGSISNSDRSTEKLVKRLSCKIELPIRSAELSLTEGNDASDVCIEDYSLPCKIESKIPPLPVTISDSESVEQEPTESVRQRENYSSLDIVPKKQDSLLNSSKFVSHVQENFQHNLTRLMTAEDLDDLSFDDEVSNRTLKSPRKSCARKSAIFISDSENSQQESCPPSLNTSVNLVDESEDHDSDSSNSASLSFAADSVPNIPVIKADSKPLLLAETPVKSASESLSGSTPVMQNSDSIWRKRDGSARRITPLKVNRSFTHQNSSFSQALAASPILSLPHSPVKTNDDFKESFSKPVINTSFDHSPIKKWRKKARVPALDSDSEDENVPQMDCTVAAETKKIDHKSSNVLNSDSEDKKEYFTKITDNSSFSRAKTSTSSVRKWRKSTEASVLDSDSEEKNVPPVKITDRSRQSFSNVKLNANFDSPIRKWRKKAVVTEIDSGSESENVSQMEYTVAAEMKKIDPKSETFSMHYNARSSVGDVDKKSHLETEDENVSEMDSTLDITAEKFDNKSMESLSKHSRTASLTQESDVEDDFLTDDSNDSEYSNSEESRNSDESGSIFS